MRKTKIDDFINYIHLEKNIHTIRLEHIKKICMIFIIL